jgi:hypothetical protein
MERINRQIILVGNGPSVLNHNIGDSINQFDTVVRFNNFVVHGFEHFVGKKTDVWARNNSNGVNQRDVSSFRQVLIVSPEWNFNNVPKIEEMYKGEQIHVIPRDYALEIQEILKLPGKDGKNGSHRAWPTTGVITLYYYLKFYPVVHIHGFDHFEGKNHYFDKQKMLTFTHFARGPMKAWVVAQIEQGRVRTLV